MYLRQWTYWIAAIITAVITILALFLKESRASQLLKTNMKKVARKHQDRLGHTSRLVLTTTLTTETGRHQSFVLLSKRIRPH